MQQERRMLLHFNYILSINSSVLHRLSCSVHVSFGLHLSQVCAMEHANDHLISAFQMVCNWLGWLESFVRWKNNLVLKHLEVAGGPGASWKVDNGPHQLVEECKLFDCDQAQSLMQAFSLSLLLLWLFETSAFEIRFNLLSRAWCRWR